MESSNLQELKDAAIELMKFTCNSCEQRFCEEDAEEEDGQRVPSLCGPIIRMRNALSANKVRNCDVGTAEEQNNRYEHYCFTHRTMERCCQDCPIKDEPCCELAWAQMPYEEKEGGAS